MPTRRARKQRARKRTRRARARGVSALVRHITEACKGNTEGETFCIENMDNVLAYYRGKGKMFVEQAELPADWKDASVVVVKMTVSDLDARHGFALVRQGKKWYRADSWQGIHGFTAKPIDIDAWLQTWKDMEARLAAGTFDREDFNKLFGEWTAEKEALRAEGEWVNDYPRSRTGDFVLTTNVWVA